MFRPFRPLLISILLLVAASPAAAEGLDEQMRWVEKIRGLSFSGPVHSVTIERSELPERLRNQLTRTLPYSIDAWTDILEALLLIEDERGETFDRLLSLYESQVLAYYDPDTQTFYALRQPPPAVKELPAGIAIEDGVIVHELTHALQDQHLEIGRRALALRHDTDASMAFHAVLEGEASLVMLAYLLEQGGADFDTLVRDPLFDAIVSTTAGVDFAFDGSAPRYFVESMKFPYLDGLRFVIAAYRRGGWAELDGVYANPPRTTREILHPEEYFEKRFVPGSFEPEPPMPLKTLSVEHLGQFHWNYLVGQDNARGWRSDRVTIVQNTVCDPTVLVESSWDSDQDAQRFVLAYMDLLEKREMGYLVRRDGSNVKVAYGADRNLMERFLR